MSEEENMKKVLAAALLTVFLFPAGGCASMKKKFIRKTPEKIVRPIAVTEQEFAKPYTNKYYYAKHFNSWKVWHDELLASIGGNGKKERRSAGESAAQLEEMMRYLAEPKRGELGRHLATVKAVTADLFEGSRYGGAEEAARTKLERVQRVVSSRFYYEKVAAFVIPDAIDLGEEAAVP